MGNGDDGATGNDRGWWVGAVSGPGWLVREKSSSVWIYRGYARDGDDSFGGMGLNLVQGASVEQSVLHCIIYGIAS